MGRCGRAAMAFLAFTGLASQARAAPADPYALPHILEARAAVATNDWATAIPDLEAIVAQTPTNGEYRLMLANARLGAHDYAGAASDFETARDLGAGDPAILAYEIARCDVLRGDLADAMTWLRTAIALGYRFLEDARADNAFAPL